MTRLSLHIQQTNLLTSHRHNNGIRKHEICYRLNNANDETTDRIRFIPAHHDIAWNYISRSTFWSQSPHVTIWAVGLTEHAVTAMNRTHRAHKYTAFWNPIHPMIAVSFNPTPLEVTSTPTKNTGSFLSVVLYFSAPPSIRPSLH